MAVDCARRYRWIMHELRSRWISKTKERRFLAKPLSRYPHILIIDGHMYLQIQANWIMCMEPEETLMYFKPCKHAEPLILIYCFFNLQCRRLYMYIPAIWTDVSDIRSIKHLIVACDNYVRMYTPFLPIIFTSQEYETLLKPSRTSTMHTI